MLRILLPITLAVALVPTAVLAQGSSSSSDSNKSSGASQSTQNLPQQIQSKLQNQGFTDVNVVPGSFLVTAKDKQGDPVTMIIGPHSMSVFMVDTSGSSSTVGSSDQMKKSGSK